MQAQMTGGPGLSSGTGSGTGAGGFTGVIRNRSPGRCRASGPGSARTFFAVGRFLRSQGPIGERPSRASGRGSMSRSPTTRT